MKSKTWRRLFLGVYVHADIPVDHRIWCDAAALLLPEGGAIAEESAAYLWGCPAPQRVSVVIPTSASLRAQDNLVVRRSTVRPEDVTAVLGLPVTTALRTAFDLARYLPRIEAVIALDTLLHKKQVHADRLRAYLATRPRWPGIAHARKHVGEADPLAESPMETRLRLLLADAGLPPPIAQHKIYRRVNGRPKFVARVDFAYPDLRIAIEYDGDHHRDRTTHRFDQERQNELHVMGWTVLRFHTDDVLRRPDELVAKVRAVLRRAAAR